ncbi:22044_t:CDS:2 [Cetraspora pellucida]|uniref:22044_t:CDS:1 n=1 Tax=Cetraspora pellucida TaxID=1433469 RepID=A0A9N9ESG2_9GLOM|nr:22044_t:CDS:2 [Cetraspora pellucida]
MCSNISYIDSKKDTILLAPELLPSIPSHINKIKTTTSPHSSAMPSLRITNRPISSIDSQPITKDLHKVGNKCDEEKNVVDYCSICTEHISVYAVSQCNHRICYLCALRSRVLFENSTCPYCRAQQNKIIFTHDSDTSFSTLLSSKAWYIISDFQILCEDELIYRMVTNMIRLRCPLKSCQVACDGGWIELSQHVRNVHKLTFCGNCVEYRKIFSWEHQLFTREELKRHCRNGDGKDSNFRGHPTCIECNVTLYDLIEFREHYLMHHSSIPLALNSSRSSQSYHNSQTLSAARLSSASRAPLSSSSSPINNEENDKDVPFIIICTFSLILSLLRMFTLPSSSNKYFTTVLQILDTYISPLFTSIFQLDLDENSQLESTLHSIFISIYSIGIRVAFVITYLTMVFWVLKSWIILMSWIICGMFILWVLRVCWNNWKNW